MSELNLVGDLLYSYTFDDFNEYKITNIDNKEVQTNIFKQNIPKFRKINQIDSLIYPWDRKYSKNPQYCVEYIEKIFEDHFNSEVILL
jgi:hypothetical protein